MTYNNVRKLAQIRKIVLGSASPRRVELLKETGVEFRQVISNVREHNDDNGDPYGMAQALAEEKARDVAGRLQPDELVIGADTVVALDNKSLGKPTDKNNAIQILKKLSGNKHTVCTALALAGKDSVIVSGFELTEVYFNTVTPEQISAYIETGEPMDKAGAYGIQGMGGFLVDRIEGELDTVIGLPRRLLEQLAGEVCLKLKKN